MSDLQTAIAEVIREKADELASLVIERIGTDQADEHLDQAAWPVFRPENSSVAAKNVVDGENGPAILVDCPQCDEELLYVECFYDNYLDSQYIWDLHQEARAMVVQHNRENHPDS